MENQRELELEKLVERTHTIAVESLRNFFSLLDLDPDLFKHLYDIEMNFDEDEDLASYSPITNEVSLNKQEYEDALYDIEDNPHRREDIEANLAVSIVHELIHANRTVLINNGVDLLNLERVKNNELINFVQTKQGYDLTILRAQLSEMLNKPYVKEFETYIPCDCKSKDGIGDVIAYNRKTKNYEKFSGGDFYDDFSKDKDKFLLSVGLKLNTLNYESVDTIYSLVGEDSRPLVACDYVDDYRPYFTKEDLSLSLDEFQQELEYEYDEKAEKLDNKNALEETLTESFAIMAVMSRKHKSLDLDLLTTQIESNEESVDLVVAARMIRALGKDTIKWFMTAAYEEYYRDELSNIFGDQYNRLLYDFSNLYNASINGDNSVKANKYEINDVKKIVKQKVLKRK